MSACPYAQVKINAWVKKRRTPGFHTGRISGRIEEGWNEEKCEDFRTCSTAKRNSEWRGICTELARGRFE